VANLASARKRIKQNDRNRVKNRARKSAIKSQTRKFNTAVHDGDLKSAQDLLSVVSKTVDQVAAKGTIHRNTASRRKSRMAKRLNAALKTKKA